MYHSAMPILYRLPYFPHCPADLLQRDDWPTIPINWADEGFRQELKKMIQPIHPPLPFPFPTDRPYITIAAHVRTGRGSDAPDSYKWWPLKFAPHHYYIESFRHIARIFPERPLYVFLFTDDPEPEQIIDYYKSQLAYLDVTFECRRKNNTHNQNVVEDWFSMLQFDCLIRSTSSYTFAQAMIGDYKVVISPVHYVWKDDQVFIDQKIFKYRL